MRIVSLAPSNTEILFALGAADDVVAVTRYCDDPPAARAKPNVGGWVDADVSKIAALTPDLALASTFLQKPLVEKLRAKGIRAELVDPRTLAGVLDSIAQVGAWAGREAEARSLVEEMSAGFSALRSNPPPRRPRVYVEEWSTPPMASGNWVPDVVEAAGGVPGVAKRGEPSAEFALADLVAFDPDVIVLSVCGAGERVDLARVLARKSWENVSAVRGGRVFVLDDALLNRPGPRLVTAARELRRVFDAALRQGR